MRLRRYTAMLLTALLAAGPAVARPLTTHGMANAKLIASAKAAPLKLIDALEVYCDTDTPIGTWLAGLVSIEARSIAWSAGACELVNASNPNDAGGDYCAQAEVTLKHPKNRRDRPEIEIYLEDPKGGRPGEVYAFRAMFDSNDGPDYIRFRKDFESEWRARFPDTPAPACQDDQ
jgi:hypothetical protein